jgi:hypothetical protein
MDKENVNKLRVIVGHCVQKDTQLSTYNHTHVFGNIIKEDKTSKTYSGLATRITDSTSIPIGITVDCFDPTNNNYKLFKVDIGVSRAQDPEFVISHQKPVKDDYDILSRTVQVLNIKTIDEIDNFFVIKSKIKNTRIYQHRPHLERLHSIKAPRKINTTIESLVNYNDEEREFFYPLEDSEVGRDKSIYPNTTLLKDDEERRMKDREITRVRQESDDSWSNKYLKYKKKYLDLKNKIH